MTTFARFASSAGCLLFALGPALAVDAGTPTAAEIDAVFADYDGTTTPGCALGVVQDGELVYKRGYGMANLELGIAISPTSVFRTGSVSKQFTAMAVAILAEQGKIDLDQPIAELFPEFPTWAEEVTIGHLVHHTSGIRDYLTLTWLAGMDDDAYYTDAFALELLARQQNLNFQPGDDFLYSNSGYLLLAHVVQRATGQTLRQWAEQNIFHPLGMTHTHFHDDHTHIVPNRADGYAPDEEVFKISMTTLDMVGDGGVYTSIEDLLLWDRNFYDNRLDNGSRDLIETVTTPGTLTDGAAMHYAFGLFVREYRGLPIIAHGGAFVGFRADTLRFPGEHLSVYTLCNRADANPGTRSRAIAELYLGDRMEPEEEPAVTDSSAPAAKVEIPVADLERLSGWYWNEADRVFQQILLIQDRLVLPLSADRQYELVPLAPNRFAAQPPWGVADLTFQAPANGPVTLTLAARGSDEPGSFVRFEPRRLEPAERAAYTGTYYSSELDVDYVIEDREGRLVFEIDKNGEHPLEPRFGELFENTDFGIFTFDRSTAGDITGFSLDAGRVRSLKFDRIEPRR